MVNSEAFAKRLEEILKYYDLSASSFAEKIDVGRASISHILSGRNKPSLDFVMKIVKEFSEVELYWLINGKGQFPKNNETTPPSKEAQPEKKSNQNYKISNNQNLQSEKQLSSEVSKVIVFYKDGRFEVFDEQI